MIQKQNISKCGKYISCIKIKGKPILPPLVTSSRREKLLDYKKKAIDVEKRIREKLNKTTDEVLCSDIFIQESNADNENVSCKNDRLNLSCDLVEASEYSSNGIRLFGDSTEQCSESISIAPNEDFCEIKNRFCLDDDFERKAPPLIRSNSYTLESPSPVLLAHLRNMGLESSFSDDTTVQNLSPDTEISTLETDDGPFNGRNEEHDALIAIESKEQYNDSARLNTLEQQNITEDVAENSVICHVDSNQNKTNLIVENKTDLILTETDVELLKALNKLAFDEKQQILVLLKSQNNKQFNTNFAIDLLTTSPSELENDRMDCERSNSIVPSDLPLSVQNVQTQISTFSETEIDIFDKNDNFTGETTVSTTFVRNILNCSKTLFFEDDIWQQHLKQRWAASVIVAYAKGYLTRRLMTTERVRSLIETIKDALVCAMQLHSESTDDINESDVELHRRLVQQISAACYAFHDVFFTLSTSEQMAIIAHDRRRLKDKTLKKLSLT